MLQGAEYIKAGAFCSSGDLSTHSGVALLSCFLAVRSVNHNFSLLNLNLLTALAGLAFLAADMLINILDALALVRLGRTLLADFRRELAHLLLVGTGDNDLVGAGTSMVIPSISATLT